MNTRHRKTLVAVFTRPTLASIVFTEIESLLKSLGGKVGEREGSRIKKLTCWVSSGDATVPIQARRQSDIRLKKYATCWSA